MGNGALTDPLRKAARTFKKEIVEELVFFAQGLPKKGHADHGWGERGLLGRDFWRILVEVREETRVMQ